LEEKHASTNVLADVEGACDGWNKGRFLCTTVRHVEIVLEIVKKRANDVKRIIQVDEQVIWLRQVIV